MPREHDVDSEQVSISAIYGANTRRGLVSVRIGDRKPMLWSPTEARNVAKLLIESAETADQDAFLVYLCLNKLGLDLHQSALLLEDFRQTRERFAADEVDGDKR